MPAIRALTLRPLMLATALALAGVGACSGQTAATAPAQTTALPSAVPAAPAPQLVTGLPDFTQLVTQVGPAVVNVQAEIGGKPAPGAQNDQAEAQDNPEIPEIFRRFFGPNGMPGMPGNRGMRPRGTSLGTGFIISADGYILTNHHVVDGADSVRIRLADRREFKAKVVGSDEKSDVALLKIEASDLPTLRIGDSKTLKPGQWVVAIGSPFGLDHSVTAGIVSAVGRANAEQQYVPFIQTDVAINRGNSGGPLLDTRGQVVGINSQIFSNSGGYQGISFAIPIDVAMNAVKQLKTTGKVQRGQLGVQIQPLSRDAAKALGLNEASGALVAEVEPGSGAERAGILRQDVIRSVNGKAVYDASDLPPIIGGLAPGSKVAIELIRDGKTKTLDATLTALDSAPATVQGNSLGIIGQELNDQQRERLGLRHGEGVQIARLSGDAAREAGLRPGDVILAVGRRDVGSVAELNRELNAAGKGKPVMLLVRRGAGTSYIAVDPNDR